MTGALIGRGRDCDVFEEGPGRVLRRNRSGRPTEAEAMTMCHVAVHGYPVPEVFDADSPDIVMQRLDGPTMLSDLSARPWTMRSKARVLVNTWLTLAAGRPGGSIATRGLVAAGRRLFVRRFLSAIDQGSAVASLPTALQLRLRDPNLSDGERAAMHDLVDRVS